MLGSLAATADRLAAQGQETWWPFDADAPDTVELGHVGVLDSRILDFARDLTNPHDTGGFEDIVTFFPGNGADPYWIRFWRTDPHGPGTTPTFTDVTGTVCANFLVGGVPDPAIFSDIYDLEVLDVDNDGDMDFVAGRQPGEDKILEMQGGVIVAQRYLGPPGSQQSEYYFTPNSSPPVLHPFRWTTGIAQGDLNGDGFTDVVMSYRGSRAEVCLNDTNGNFVDGGTLPAFPDEVGHGAGHPWVKPGTNPMWPFPGNGGRNIHMVDLDPQGPGAGLLDIILVRTNGQVADPPNAPSVLTAHIAQIAVYRNVGTMQAPSFVPWYKLLPQFVLQGQTEVSLFDENGKDSKSLQVWVADVNADGLPDLVAPVIDSPNSPAVSTDRRTRIYLNSSATHPGVLGGRDANQDPTYRPNQSLGTKTDHAERLGGCSFAGSGDLDGDGKVDLLTPHHQENLMIPTGLWPIHGYLEDIGDRVWLGNGTGMTWTTGINPTTGRPLDIRPKGYVPANYGVELPAQGVLQDNTRYTRFADLDHDGDLDCVETSFFNPGEPGIDPSWKAKARVLWNHIIN